MLSNFMKNPWAFSICLTLTITIIIMPDFVYASTDGTVIGDVLCNVVSWFTGTVGKGIATLAIIVIGIGALMGKVSWGMAIIVGVGVAVIFGASDLVGQISDGTDGC